MLLKIGEFWLAKVGLLGRCWYWFFSVGRGLICKAVHKWWDCWDGEESGNRHGGEGWRARWAVSKTESGGNRWKKERGGQQLRKEVVKRFSKHNDAHWILTNIYAPCSHPKKREFLQWFKNIDMPDAVDWLIVGDFNLIRNQKIERNLEAPIHIRLKSMW